MKDKMERLTSYRFYLKEMNQSGELDFAWMKCVDYPTQPNTYDYPDLKIH